MTPAERLVDWLEPQPTVDGATVVGWRCEVVEGQGVRGGVRDSQLGGPYEGPGAATRLGGSLELHWSDGSVTRAGLDRDAVLDPDREAVGWREDAVNERHGRAPPLAGPTVLQEVQVYDPLVGHAIADEPVIWLRLLRQLLERTSTTDVVRVDAVMRLGQNERTVATSRGFRASWQETSCSLELWADEMAGASFGRRCFPSPADLDRLVKEVSALAPRLRTEASLPSTSNGVIFMPSVVQELLSRLVLPNLSGRAIRDGRSPFTRADLEAGRQVVRDDFSIVVDTTLPFELSTAPCSSEGVPAGCRRLVADGRFVSPVLDLATARDFELPPTPAARGRPVASLTTSQPELSYDEALTMLDTGVVVRQLPGLHTQQPRRSSYALVVPDAQVVVRGWASGRCAVRLAGNVLMHLARPSTRLVRIPGELGAGLLVLGDVALWPA